MSLEPVPAGTLTDSPSKPDLSNAALIPGGWRRRGLAFGLDIALGQEIANLFTSSLVRPGSAPLVMLIHAVVMFAYWAGSELLLRGATPGKWLFGLRAVNDDGTDAGRRAVLVRAAVLVGAFGIDAYELLSWITAGHAPTALQYLQSGLGLGFGIHAGLRVLTRRHRILLHDQLSHTRVVRRVPEPTDEFAEPTRPPRRRDWMIVPACVALALVLGVLTGDPPGLPALWTPPPHAGGVLGEMEKIIAQRFGLRSDVLASESTEQRTGEPTHHALEFDVTLPWGTDSPEKADSIFTAVTRSLWVDPAKFDRLRVVIRSSRGGLLDLHRNRRWSLVQDPERKDWVPDTTAAE